MSMFQEPFPGSGLRQHPELRNPGDLGRCRFPRQIERLPQNGQLSVDRRVRFPRLFPHLDVIVNGPGRDGRRLPVLPEGPQLLSSFL